MKNMKMEMEPLQGSFVVTRHFLPRRRCRAVPCLATEANRDQPEPVAQPEASNLAKTARRPKLCKRQGGSSWPNHPTNEHARTVR